jgi:hypothetical protein
MHELNQTQATEPIDRVMVAPAPYVTIEQASVMIGLTPKACRKKIECGVWLEGREYRRGPDGRIYVSISGFKNWVEGRR